MKIGNFMKYFLILLTSIIFNQANAGLPVTPVADQASLLLSKDPKLETNKRLVYDFTRIILAGRRLEQAAVFLNEDYIQHNPNVETGLKGFLDFFSKLGGSRPIPDTIKGLVAITTEGDLVTMAFVDARKDVDGVAYTTTWFDMFRIESGKIAEHWDNDTK